MLTLSGTQFAPIRASKISCVAPGFRRIPFQASYRISYPASFEAELCRRLTTSTGVRYVEFGSAIGACDRLRANHGQPFHNPVREGLPTTRKLPTQSKGIR